MSRKDNRTLKIKSGKFRKFLLIFLIFIAFCAAAFGGYLLLKNLTVSDKNSEMEQIRNDSLGIESAPITAEQKDNYTVAANYPRFLSIEKMNVKNARILALGVLKPDKNGGQQLDAPNGIYDVGWYDCTVNPVAEKKCAQPKLPGDGDTETAALIDGHSCSASLNCVFNNLANLADGDKIVVELGNGDKINYTVRETEIVNYKDANAISAAMQKAMKPISADREGLNLITCAGNWTATDAQNNPTMDKRVFVFAARED